jgi:hypothetical protein
MTPSALNTSAALQSTPTIDPPVTTPPAQTPAAPPKRGRGRPKGSTNTKGTKSKPPAVTCVHSTCTWTAAASCKNTRCARHCKSTLEPCDVHPEKNSAIQEKLDVGELVDITVEPIGPDHLRRRTDAIADWNNEVQLRNMAEANNIKGRTSGRLYVKHSVRAYLIIVASLLN